MISFFVVFIIYFSSILPHLLFGDLGNLYFFFFFGLYFLVLASPVFCAAPAVSVLRLSRRTSSLDPSRGGVKS